jgi:hypothetical protein
MLPYPLLRPPRAETRVGGMLWIAAALWTGGFAVALAACTALGSLGLLGKAALHGTVLGAGALGALLHGRTLSADLGAHAGLPALKRDYSVPVAPLACGFALWLALVSSLTPITDASDIERYLEPGRAAIAEGRFVLMPENGWSFAPPVRLAPAVIGLLAGSDMAVKLLLLACGAATAAWAARLARAVGGSPALASALAMAAPALALSPAELFLPGAVGLLFTAATALAIEAREDAARPRFAAATGATVLGMLFYFSWRPVTPGALPPLAPGAAAEYFAQPLNWPLFAAFAAVPMLLVHPPRAEHPAALRMLVATSVVAVLMAAASEGGAAPGLAMFASALLAALWSAGVALVAQGVKVSFAPRLVSSLVVAFAMVGALKTRQQVFAEGRLSPRPALTEDSRRAMYAAHGTMPEGWSDVHIALAREPRVGRVVGLCHPSPFRGFNAVRPIAAGPLPRDPGTIAELHEVLRALDITHVVGAENPGVAEDLWEQFLDTQTEVLVLSPWNLRRVGKGS